MNITAKNALRLIALSTHDKFTKELALRFLEESEGVASDELSQTCWRDYIMDLRSEIKKNYGGFQYETPLSNSPTGCKERE